ncbi:MAG: hypothetical protein OPY07_00015, partial [Nitrosopumilus sp.]|nr:hypothetical protein [Nitrosopumilus sp.]
HYKDQGCDNAVCLIEKHVNPNIIKNVYPQSLIYQGPISLDARIRYYDDNWLRSKISDNDWYINADVDEFTMTDKKLCELIAESKHDHIRGYLVDRHTEDYHIPINLEGDIWAQFPIESRFSRDNGAHTQKVVAASKEVEIEIGHHGCKSNDFDSELILPVYHFKWWGTVVDRLEKRNQLDLPWNRELENQLSVLKSMRAKSIKVV